MYITSILLNACIAFMKKVYVFHIFYFMLQNEQSMDQVSPSLPGFLIEFACIYVCGHLAFCCYHWVSPFNPGALIGICVVGCIGVIGCTLGHWNRFAALALCLLGGCIGSGMYRINEDHQNRYRAINNHSVRKAIYNR